MYQNFSIETFVKEQYLANQKASHMNAFAVISSKNIDFSDYLSFLKPPADIEDLQKYICDHPAIEMRELISVHEPIECENLINTGVVDSVEKQYVEDFDFHLLNLYFDVRPKYNLKLNSVAVNATFNDFALPSLRPRVISLFPTADVFKKSETVSGKVVVTGGKGFEFVADGEAGQAAKSGEADFVYDYRASRKSVMSAQTGSGFFYKFFTAADSTDTQTFRVRAILLRPRPVKKILMKISFIINEFPVEYHYASEIPVVESNVR
ncbi:MAG: hypothetical protein A2008_02550 [Candidatus Wallbacteria bacterium GWC2_49_35]|uniref:Uncharacterized protein n=1 Tax=Candidatus Wallbacteria bacterium GWC2_49_35 TaxID=1817813 RepID=A0A1F7WVX7_9BACT|nr:MAG: hypothetical protein A2008_02550 [Candidatus Wallbacteria bacterium GWC2_49_35]HBC73297.1 hypothetical protein [Candidatus Wallbacteria bacterium]